ncbi:transcription factor mef2A-like [Condylostylus longicornis]|uniref:transcription factor mef2A-like n=1 Tax=Condylostylus longicornis TaxID=2530218 RepID=UPI00244DA97E|nr:transcription factor mef2A-like [Condylostylus longicornis]
MELVDEENAEEKIMTRNQLKLLVNERLNYEQEFQMGTIKKAALWSTILIKVKEKDPTFSFSKNESIVKFSNCFTTYKRIKKRFGETGKSSTSWEFFDQFDEVYGDSFSINPNENLFLSSNEGEGFDNKSNTNTISFVGIDSNNDNDNEIYNDDNYNNNDNYINNDNNDEHADDDNTDSERNYENQPNPKKRKFSNIAEVIRYETEQTERHHRELLAVEREKIIILRQVKDLMEAFLN